MAKKKSTTKKNVNGEGLPTIEEVANSTNTTSHRPEPTESEGEAIMRAYQKLRDNDPHADQNIEEVKPTNDDGWFTQEDLFGSLEDDTPDDATLDLPDVPVPPFLKAFRTYLRSTIVLNRVYPVEVEYNGERFTHVSFHGISDFEKPSFAFHPKDEPRPIVPMFKVRLHRAKPFASIDSIAVSQMKLCLNTPDESDMLKRMKYAYEAELNLPFENPDNTVLLQDPDLTEDMVAMIFDGFDRLTNQVEQNGCLLVHIKADGTMETKVGSEAMCQSLMVRLREECYPNSNPYLREVMDIMNDTKQTLPAIPNKTVSPIRQYYGFVAVYHDNTMAVCFTSPMSGTFPKPLNQITQYMNLIRDIDVDLVNKVADVDVSGITKNL